MRKYSLLLSLTFWALAASSQTVFFTKLGEVSFFSAAPLENIDGKTDKAVILFNGKENEIIVNIQVKSFYFQNSLMREHFNEKYMETERYPIAEFKGEFTEPIDLTKPGTYEVSVKGKLSLHGKTESRIVTGKITISDTDIFLESAFDIHLKDHNVDIPSMLTKNIAEVVQVKIKGYLSPSDLIEGKSSLR
ncbi:MAG: polyisoprenoid-binding protein YceI [Sphingobacteriales bacterium]|jgi:polyisoprenoid-binding protein YceI